MFDSTFDLISQAVSSNLYVFCIFNLIIVMIVMGSKHDYNGFDQDYQIPLSTHTAIHHKQDTYDQNETVAEESKEDGSDCNGDETDASDEEDEKGDDELRRRIEEFIAKVNREWRAEKLANVEISL